MSKITVLPYDCPPILQKHQEKSEALARATLGSIRNRDMNDGRTLKLNKKQDVVCINPPPIVVSTDLYTWDKYYYVTDKQYPNVFRNMALGTETDDTYSFFFARDTAELLGSEADEQGITRQLRQMISEIKNNFVSGSTDPMANIQTKFMIGNVEFSFDELLASKTHMQYAQDIIRDTDVTCYSDYADMGIAIGYIKNFSKGMSDAQSNLLNGKISEFVDKYIDRTLAGEQRAARPDDLETYEKLQQSHPHKDSMSATNQEYASEAMSLFTDLDFSDKNAVASAFRHFAQLESETEMMTTVNTMQMNHSIEAKCEKLEGHVLFAKWAPGDFEREIQKIAPPGVADERHFVSSTAAADRPKSPSEVAADYAKAVEQPPPVDSAASHYKAFGNLMLTTYNFLAEQHQNFGAWADYYRDSMEDGSDLKKRAAFYTDYAAERLRQTVKLEDLISQSLTFEEEALAYRTYGDAFLTKKAEYYDQAQRNTEEYGYRMGKQFAWASKLLDAKLQDEYGEDLDLFKLQFKRECFLDANSDLGFWDQLMRAIDSIKKQIESLEKAESADQA